MHGDLPILEDTVKRVTGIREPVSVTLMHGCSVRTGVDGDGDLTASRRKFEGIAEQIDERTLEFIGISNRCGSTGARSVTRVEPDRWPVGPTCSRAWGTTWAGANSVQTSICMAGFQFMHVQHVIDHPQQGL